ncbi:NYN domain-containing protein [Rhodococcus rhodochrous]|uniref:NYN domain-containing protein n=1 Tax=Rhodococcus rhodochrous TaxID=1829 RepID=A0AA46WWG6_RHORH|nr:NYN domain-containing protein [Rhodococcus rhodochrous]UZF45377.1 NYN domain-containing protein [Rhodococcus rhodochrous]
MRVGVYIDAYNLYYGMRSFCGRGTAGWRWLDVRALAQTLCGWGGSSIERVVYCTARVDPADSQSAYNDQDVYLKALKEHGSIDVLELGRYVARAKKAPLARETRYGGAEIITPSDQFAWSGLPIYQQGDDMYIATIRNREEKGSDVNVATHLLASIFMQEVDAAIVISNDSDLALPLTIARTMVPVGTVNPGSKPLAGALRGRRDDGPGRHWWKNLSADFYYDHQMPNQVGRWHKPAGW